MGREAPVPADLEPRVLAADLIAGGIAGAAADSVAHPLDTVKARMQVSTSARPYRSIAHAMRLIAREEGVRRGLYAGFGAVLAGTIPTHAVMFGAYKGLKRRAEPHTPDGGLRALDFACGAAGEVVALVPYVPAEVVAKRMQVAALGPARDYRGVVHALRVIYATEGVRGLYAGLVPTTLRDVPFTAIQFTLFSLGKEALGGEVGGWAAVALGGAVGGVAAAATNPADVVKTRLMTQGAGSDRPYRGVAHCFARIVRDEGWGGLMKGVAPRVAWIAPASGITLAVFEYVSGALRPAGAPR